jgi:hypothetical protein
MRFMTRVGVAINDKDMFLRQKEGACVRSLLTMDCLERGCGIFHGGARFYNIQNEACGITNAANALCAEDAGVRAASSPEGLVDYGRQLGGRRRLRSRSRCW